MNWDMVAFAWGGFRFDGEEFQLYGRTRGVEIEQVVPLMWRVRFTVPRPYEDDQYRVQLNQEGPITVRLDTKTSTEFTIVAPDGAPFLAWFTVLP